MPRQPAQCRYWHRIPEGVHEQVVATALEYTELSPRELACRITDREGHFLWESDSLTYSEDVQSPCAVIVAGMRPGLVPAAGQRPAEPRRLHGPSGSLRW